MSKKFCATKADALGPKTDRIRGKDSRELLAQHSEETLRLTRMSNNKIKGEIVLSPKLGYPAYLPPSQKYLHKAFVILLTPLQG
jgi:hypothetical protein